MVPSLSGFVARAEHIRVNMNTIMAIAFKSSLFLLIASTYLVVTLSLGGISGKGIGVLLSVFLSRFGLAFWVVIIFVSLLVSGVSLLLVKSKEFGRHRLPLFIAIILLAASNLYLFFMTAE